MVHSDHNKLQSINSWLRPLYNSSHYSPAIAMGGPQPWAWNSKKQIKINDRDIITPKVRGLGRENPSPRKRD